jgi:putative ABC transport system permease protein
MRLSDYLRLARRESRRARGRVLLFIACIALGVAAVVVVAGFSAGIDEGLRDEGRRLLAADVAVDGWRPIPAELDAILSAAPARRTDVRKLASVVLGPGGRAAKLCEIKVIDAGYPFYGVLRFAPDRPAAELLAPDAAVVAPELLAHLDARLGDELSIGGVSFRVAGTVEEEPDKLGVNFTVGPRVFLSPAGAARTTLEGRGARIEHRALIKLPDGATLADATRLVERIRKSLPGAAMFGVHAFDEAQPALRQSVARIGDYLGLVGLLSLLVGGVGVAQVSRAWLSGRMDDIAVLRCLGATPGQVVALYAIQVVAMALLASAVGAALGTGLHGALPRLVGGLLPPDVIRPLQPWAIALGIGLGMSVALTFTLPSLLGLWRVPPARVLLREAEPVQSGMGARAALSLLVVCGVWAAAAVQSRSLLQGGLFTGGLGAVIGVLAAIAVAVSRLARLVPRGAGALGVRVRHGLTHLARPGAEGVGSIVALGLGVTFVFATAVIERHLTEQLRAELPPGAPSTIFLDVQPDQWAGLRALLEQEGATDVDGRPVVTARLTAVDDVPIAELAASTRDEGPAEPRRRDVPPGAGERERPSRWALTREQRITYGPDLPRGNRVVAGAFPSARRQLFDRGSVSVEEGFARDLGVHVGSTLSLDVQGVPVDLAVTSVRTIDWRTFGINLLLFAEPGPLDAAPQTRIVVARFPQASLGHDGGRPETPEARVVRAYPNVTVLDVRDVVEKVLAVLGQLAIAVRSLGWFIVAAGIVVLGGTVTATQARRAREVALLKAIGMTRRDVITVFAIEYALTGAVAALVGLAAGSGLAWVVITQVLQVPWTARATELVAAGAIVVALAVAAGLAASARALSAPPAAVLRSE